MRVQVEVCVTNVAEALAAARCGADAVELCSWLEVGGVTPSAGAILAVQRAVQLPLRVLVRPDPWGFVHAAPDQEVLLADAEWIARTSRTPRIVTGGLTPDGQLDLSMMAPIRAWGPAGEVTFHRAIDHALDPLLGVERCLELGVHRILTSGAAPRAVEGLRMLRAMVDRAQGKLRIAAAGRISADDVLEVVGATGVTEVHFAAQRASDHGVGLVPDEAKILRVMETLDKAGLR